MQISGDTIAKWFGIIVTIGVGFVALYTRIHSLEEARDGHANVLTEHRLEIRKLGDRVSELERSREMLERVHSIELRLGSIEELLREKDDDRRSRKRYR
jgi:Mg2+ and Co2+ transporter CorA